MYDQAVTNADILYSVNANPHTYFCTKNVFILSSLMHSIYVNSTVYTLHEICVYTMYTEYPTWIIIHNGENTRNGNKGLPWWADVQHVPIHVGIPWAYIAFWLNVPAHLLQCLPLQLQSVGRTTFTSYQSSLPGQLSSKTSSGPSLGEDRLLTNAILLRRSKEVNVRIGPIFQGTYM